MSKKRAKSSSAPGRWEAGLFASALEDENWKVSVNFIIENQLGDSLHIKHLANVVKIPQRRLFSIIQKEDLLALIDEIGNPKTRKTKDLPQYYEITEVIKTMQEAGEEIPIHLWAKLIKFALLDVKTNDLKRRDMEGKMKDEKEKGKGSGKKRARSKSPVKGGKGKKTPEPQLPKKDWSSLKKRGEEDTGDKYIDDEPDDGVQHYIFVSGFRQAPLFTLLAELGVNVSSVIKLQSDSYTTIEMVKSQMNDLTQPEVSKDEDATAAEKAKNETKEKELAVFWKLLPTVLQRAPHNYALQDLSMLEYIVQETIHPANWNDADSLIGYGTALFEDLACMVYTSLDWRRQYLNYLKNMNLLHVPLHGEVERTEPQSSEQADPPPAQPPSTQPPSAQSATGKRDKGKAAAVAVEPAPDELVPPLQTEQIAKEVDTRYYSDLMDLIPQESVSVPLIMHCLLEQIRAIEQDLIPPSEIPREQRNDGIHLALADSISGALESLSLTEEERKALSGEFPSLDENFQSEVQEKNKKSLEPSLMQYGDNVMVRTHHLATFHDFHPKSSEEALLHRLPCARLWDYQQTSPQLSKERSTRLQELLRNCTMLSGDSDGAITYSEIDRAFKQFVFETMNMSSVDENGCITKPEPQDNLESPWDDPYTLAVRIGAYLNRTGNGSEEEGADKETPKESSLEIFEKENPALVPKRVLDNWCYAEHFHPEVFLQVLTDASEVYPSLDTYYHKRDHSLLAVFHCPMNKKLYATEEWSTSLHSDVGFRNYLEYVSESISDWTKCEEEKHQAELLKRELEKVQAALTSTEASANTPLPPPTAPGKRPRSKSPKKGSRKSSTSRSSSKLGPTGDEISYSSPFIRAGSLKAQSEDKAKLHEEEERKKAEKETKLQSGRKASKAKSASSKISQDEKPAASGKASKAARRSPKSKSRSLSRSRSRSSSGEREPATVVETPKPIPSDLPFTGYDVGNNLVNLYGNTSYLYPCDGGIIKAEKIVSKQGSTTVSTTIRKDGHVFLVHLIDPKDPEDDKELDELLIGAKKDEITEKSELESAEKEKDDEPARRLSSRTSETFEEKPCHSKFGSWNAALCDGMTLSFSCYGDSGECAATSKAEAKLMKLLGEIPCAISPTPAPPDTGTPKKGKGKVKSPRGRSPRGKSPKGKRKSDPDKEAEAMRLEEERMKEELERKLREAKEAEEERKRKKQPPFPQLYVSTPDGLSVRYQPDPTATTENYMTGVMQNKLLVRQSYPYKTLGKQKTESLRAHPAMEEVSRCIKSDGTVIKVMKDGSSKILFVDGTTCFNHGSGPLVQERNIPLTPHSMSSARTQQMQGRSSAGERRNTTSPGSKKGTKGRKSSGKTNPNTSGTEPSVSGTDGGGGAGGTLTAAAGLEADVGALAEADLVRASSWHTATMNGESYVSRPNGRIFPKEPLLSYKATDPVTGEVLMSREDHVIRVERPDGTVICEHSDGTRITQYNCEIEKSLYEAEGEESESSMNAVNTVRHVRVECPGFATISFNCDEGSCLTAFGSGTNLLTTPDATYQMSHWNGGRLDIDREGTVTYTPRPDNDLYIGIANEGETEEGTDLNVSNPNDKVFEGQMAPQGSYIMRHNADVCCEALDHEGNVFQVRKYGDINVMNPANEAALSGESISFLPQVSVTSDPLDHHPPRFFVIHENGSGTELLRYKDVQEYLSDAELDPTTAVIKEPLPDTPGVLGITVMRPHFGNSSEAWLTQKMEENIIPDNIRSRDLALFPPIEYKKPGPAFGTSVGKGVAVGSVPAIPEPLPTPPCPAVLELRQLVQFQPVTNELRSRLKRNLIEIGNIVLNREQQRTGAGVQDPKSWEENVHANDLLSLVLEFDEGQITPKISTAPQPSGQSGEGGITKKSTKAAAVHEQQAPNIIRAIYEESVTPPQAPKLDRPKSKLTLDDWDRIRRGIEEEKLGLQALKHRNVPPYFESKEGRAWLMTQAPDLDAMSRQLAPDPRKDGTEAKMASRDKEKDRKQPMQKPGQTTDTYTIPTQSRASENGTTANTQVSDTPSKMRPTNPTPGHASGKGTPTKVRSENPTPIAASQARTVRPSNPTPSHAYGGGSNAARQTIPDGTYGPFPPSPIPENPTSAQKREGSTLYEESTSSDMVLPVDTTAASDLVMTRSLLYDVSGEVRKEKVRLPLSILSDKPAAIPNKQFKSVEEPVRRKVKTSSVAETVNKGIAKRGFELLPPEIVFGVLKEGNTYSYTARLKNTGIDTCRFKVKQPPPGTGLRVHYTPGPVAAGMDTLLHMECYAIAVGVEGDSGIGTINHQLEIITETELLCLPISAIVLTAHDYDRRTDNMPPGGKAPGVKLLSAKPPSREGIVRPMKITT